MLLLTIIPDYFVYVLCILLATACSEIHSLYQVSGKLKFAKPRSGCRCGIYRRAEKCHGKVRHGSTTDGICYVGNSPHLYFQLVFEEKAQAEDFETEVGLVPSGYRMRPLSQSSSGVLADIVVEDLLVQSVVSNAELRRVKADQYKAIGGDSDASPDYDACSNSEISITSAVDVTAETRLRLVEREDSVALFRQKPEKCHLISQTKFKDDKKNPNNIVFMSRNLHQQFDAIDSSEGIPMFYLEYIEHEHASIHGVVSNKPCQVYETTVDVVFKDEECASTLGPFFINYSRVASTKIRIKLFFPAPLEFKDFAKVNAEDKVARWKSYDRALNRA